LAGLTLHDVKLRWAHAEALSPRWRSVFLSKAGESLCRKAESLPPEALSASDQERLIAAMMVYRCNLVEKYLNPMKAFEWRELTPEKLGNAWTMAEMNYVPPITLERYAADAFSPVHIEEPRFFAWQILQSGAPLRLNGPLIMISDGKADTLVEGYTRATVLLSRRRDGQAIPNVKAIVGFNP
jgi:hypothetical protein